MPASRAVGSRAGYGAAAAAVALSVGGGAAAAGAEVAERSSALVLSSATPTSFWRGEVEWEYRSVPGYPGATVVQQARVTPTPTSRINFVHDPDIETDFWEVRSTWTASANELNEWVENGPPPRRCTSTVRGTGSGDALPIAIAIREPMRTYRVEIRPTYSGADPGTFQAAQTFSCAPERNGPTPRPFWAGRQSGDRPLPDDWSRSKRLTGSVTRDAGAGRVATLRWDLTLVTPPAVRDTVAPSVTTVSISRTGTLVVRFRVSEAASLRGELKLLSTCTLAGCGGRARVVRTLPTRAVRAGPVVLTLGRVVRGLYRLRLVLTDRVGNKRVVVRDFHRRG